MKAQWKTFALALALSLLLGRQASFGDLLYDVTFNNPPNQVGQPPYFQTTGSPRLAPTQNIFGNSIVVSALGGLSDQPLHLIAGSTGGSFRYGQLGFDLGGFATNYPYYHLQMGVFLDNFGANDLFTLLVDSPSVSTLDFHGNGTISQGVPFPNPAYPNLQIGTFQLGTTFALAVDINVPSNAWTIAINNQQIYAGQFFYPYPAHPTPPSSLAAFRINLSDDPTTTDVPTAAIDNIVTIGTIPEPSTFALLLVGVASTLLFGSRVLRPSR